MNQNIAGSSQGGVNATLLSNIIVPLPPLPEQRRIASILSTVDEAIQRTQVIIDQSQRVKKGLMQQLLAKGIGHTRFKESPLGEIPEEWELVRLEKVADVTGGSTPSTSHPEYWDGDIPFVTPTDVTRLRGRNALQETERRITEEGLRAMSGRVLPPGTVLITTRATIGYCCIANVPLVTNQGFGNLTCKSEMDNLYALYLIRSFRRRLDRLSSGSTYKEVSKRSLKRMFIPLPKINEQRQIASILSTVDDNRHKEREKRQKLVKVKKGLMQVLLTGEVRVKVDS